VKDFSRAKVGQIICYDRFFDQRSTEGFVDGPVWAVALQPAPQWQHIQRVEVFIGATPGIHDTDNSDHGVVVPDEEVPDEVWVALAKWRLMQ
jgi:hypothetical protein